MTDLRIHGRVVDAQARPVPGARVALGTGQAGVQVPDVALLTGDDGTFWLDVPAPGEYAVHAHTDTGSAETVAQVPGGGEVVLRVG